ncbi:MAG: DUF3419 family protein [Bacteroidota bacterium]
MLRYAQCWEDADVLLAGLAIQPGARCLSVASAGDNTLALLTADPAEVVAIDMNPAQLAALALRVAAYRTLTHAEVLELIGSNPSARRRALYERCRPLLNEAEQAYWDAQPIEAGIGTVGRFERYFETFRRRILPLAHGQDDIEALFEPRDRAGREAFYADRWNTWRWRTLFRLFFSRPVMAALGRSRGQFVHVEGGIADRVLVRARHAMTDLAPSENPYLQWIALGRHRTALPLALRPEHFDTIRSRLDRLSWQQTDLAGWLCTAEDASIDACNLSDVFEYLTAEQYEDHLRAFIRILRPGGRLAYWNMRVPRRRPEAMAGDLASLHDLACRLHNEDKACFYQAFVIEERSVYATLPN